MEPESYRPGTPRMRVCLDMREDRLMTTLLIGALPMLPTEMHNWMHVQNYICKAEQTPDVGVSQDQRITHTSRSCSPILFILYVVMVVFTGGGLIQIPPPFTCFQSDPVVLAKVKAAMGLSLLHTKKYNLVRLHICQLWRGKGNGGASYEESMNTMQRGADKGLNCRFRMPYGGHAQPIYSYM